MAGWLKDWEEFGRRRKYEKCRHCHGISFGGTERNHGKNVLFRNHFIIQFPVRQKAKLSPGLCLIRPSQWNILMTGGIILCIFNLNIRLRWAESFVPTVLYPATDSLIPIGQAPMWIPESIWTVCPYRESISGHAVHSLVTELSRILTYS
jgi:hypothetical protein